MNKKTIEKWIERYKNFHLNPDFEVLTPAQIQGDINSLLYEIEEQAEQIEWLQNELKELDSELRKTQDNFDDNLYNGFY